MFLVRPAGPADQAGLVALDSFAAQSADCVTSIGAWITAGWCFCAEEDGVLAGYGVVHPHFFGRDFLELIMVGEAHRRQGVGGLLLRHALNQRMDGFLWTSTNRSNLPMLGLLAAFGFEQKGSIEGLDEGDPELVFRSGAT